MSLLDQDIPSARHTCSRCNVVFGQGASRARHVHGRDQSQYNDGPRKITVFINPSRRPYAAPFRRVQTLDRLLQYISTLPHPQVRFVTNANPAKPAFRACEEMLFAGQWQLVDNSGCIIRPEDYEELIHDGMDITIDTLPYEQQQEESIPVLQPMAVSGGKSIQGGGSQIGRNEVAGDLLDMQINVMEPMAAQHVRARSEAPVAQYTSGGAFVPSFVETVDMNELEGEDNSESQLPPRNTFIMPPKPTSWSLERNNLTMSAAAAEFRPGGRLQPPASPVENPLLHLRQATGKRSMAIPIVKPPSPDLSMAAASKPDMPITSHDDDEDEADDWSNRVAATAEPEEVPVVEESVAAEAEEWEDQAEEVDAHKDEELSQSFISTEEQGVEIPPATEESETASVSDTVVEPVAKYEESQSHFRNSPIQSRSVTPKQPEETPQYEDTSSQNDLIEQDNKFEDESHLFDDDIPEPSNEGIEAAESVPEEAKRSETPIAEAEVEDERQIDEDEEATEETNEEPVQVPAEKPSSAEMLEALMSGAEFEPASNSNPQAADGNLGWDEEPEQPVSNNNLNPAAGAWDTLSWGGDFHATSGGNGWGDWSVGPTSTIDDSQWDNRGHVRRDSEGDAEWGPPKPKKPEYVEAPKPANSAWGKGAAIEWPSRPTAVEPGPAVAPVTPTRPPAAPPKKAITITITNPTSGQPITFPPRPGSSSKSPKQKRNAPCKYVFFVPSPNCKLPNATNSNKVSLVESTTIRKLAQLYAKHFQEFGLLSCVNNSLNNPVINLTVSRSEGGVGIKHHVEVDRKLADCDFGNEFWVSIVYSGSKGNGKKG